MKGKRAILIFFVLVILILAPMLILSHKRSLELRAAEEQKKQADIHAVEAVILPAIQTVGITDLKILSIEEDSIGYYYYLDVYSTSDTFSQLSNTEKLRVLNAADSAAEKQSFAFPDGSVYQYDYNYGHLIVLSDNYLYKSIGDTLWVSEYDSEYGLTSPLNHYDKIYDATPSNSSSSSNSSSGEKCYWCNGTGSVRYNYGSSDLDAILSGHDPYTYGTCASCGGTGKAK